VKKLGEMEQKNRLHVLEQLKSMLEDGPEAIPEKAKVTVMGDSPEAVAKGLDKAKDLLDPAAAMGKESDEEIDPLDAEEDEAMEHDDKDRDMEMLHAMLKSGAFKK
jgi:hypothetical protein